MASLKAGSRWPRPEYVKPDWDGDGVLLLVIDESDNVVGPLRELLGKKPCDLTLICAEIAGLRNALNNWHNLVGSICMQDGEIKKCGQRTA